MKNACSRAPQDVKTSTPQWAVEAATGIGAEMIDRIAHTGVRVLDDPVRGCAVTHSNSAAAERGGPTVTSSAR
ncbi:hypothetical protein ACFY1U_00445 [Streptomyces sp. NPDC001351]|uniref:hypothetical protein n=1 Tax=Streptomyces sp. NPDC001351 TaxID=3364564 RepID=UPI00368C5B59